MSLLVTAGVWLKVGTESLRWEMAAAGWLLLAGGLAAGLVGLGRRRALLSVDAAKAPSAYLMAAMAMGLLASAGVALAVICT